MLKNGGYVHGQILEHDPDDGTTVLFANGATKRYSADTVAEVKPAREAARTEPSSTGIVPEGARRRKSVRPDPSDDPSHAAPEGASDERSLGGEDEGAFTPHLRGGMTLGIGGGVMGTAGAFAASIVPRIGITFQEGAAVYYEPAVSVASDNRSTIVTVWNHLVGEIARGPVVLAGGVGMAPTCMVTDERGCVGGVLSMVARASVRPWSDDVPRGTTFGVDFRAAFVPGGAPLLMPTFQIGWDLL